MWLHLQRDRGPQVPTSPQAKLAFGGPRGRQPARRSFWALALLASVPARADLDFQAFTRDPQGYDSHIRLVDGSQIEYYSDEFNELCPELGAGPIAAENPLGQGCHADGGTCMQGISQRFQHPQVRQVEPAQRAALPDMQYLDDGQLDNPYSGRVSAGNYTEVVTTKEFIPDGDLLPLPHTRTQLCHYALRLTQPVSAQNSAAWSRFKQLVAYGFETEFHFRVFHRTKECFIDDWCEPAGADGFAFVVQNEGRKIVGNDISGNGYGFRYSLAVEFDMHRNVDLGELSGNHISVHVPARKGEPNSADHGVSSIAYTDDIPPLQEGTHVVRIKYDVRMRRWDQRGSDFDSDATGAFFRLQESGRAGLLSVELDGRRVIVVPVDLAQVVNVDGTQKASANTPRQPDPESYDEKGASPGRAWVGFSSSTSYFQYQSVDILSWTFQEMPACPIDGVEDSRRTVRGEGPEVRCIIRTGTEGRSTCTWDGQSYCGLIIQNAGRSAIKISAHTSHHLPHEYEGCDYGVLDWDALHPWFLGCRRTVRFTHELQELWITSLDGVRAITISDDQILQKAPVLFKRQSLFQYCVMEHKYDPFAFYFAECNCEYCMRLLSISNLYNILYQHKCSARYGLFCPCFEASEVAHDTSQWTTLDPLRHMRIHICRGCSFTSHCALMLKVAICEISDTGYQLGNPLAPTILSNGFINTSLDENRVPTGYLRGDACNCEPQVRPYIGDTEGRSGLCSEQSNLGSGTFVDLFGCADLCQQTARCNFLTFWEISGECRIYKECFWELCSNDYCFQSSTYRNEALGEYLTLRGSVQEFIVFPRRTLQTNSEDCQSCLHLYDHTHCLHQCGNPDLVPYLHWPAGQACATCIFAGNRMHEMNLQQTQIVKDCVYAAIRSSQDPWVACDEVALEQSGSAAQDLFNGVTTHYLSECPGRGFKNIGAVCVPNLHAMNAFPLQVLSRMAAINDTVWGSELQCLNAVCEMVPRWTCYERWVEWVLNGNNSAAGMLPNLQSTMVNDAPITPASLAFNGELIHGYMDLNKSREQLMVSDPVELQTENATLEAWIRLGQVEEIKNMVLQVPAYPNSEWSEDYLPKFACDGILTTYWSSQVGIRGIQTHEASLWLDLDGFQNGGAVIIYWKEPASDYSVSVSLDNLTWWTIIEVQGNQDTYNFHEAFFGAKFLKLHMTRAAATRGPGIDEGKPVFSIYELEVERDTNVARLKTTTIFNFFEKPPESAIDGDLETSWMTAIGSPSAEFYVDLGTTVKVMATKLSWRFRPGSVKVFVGPNPCSAGVPTEQFLSLSSGLVLDFFEVTANWEGQCMVVVIEETRTFFGEQYVGIREVEFYTDSDDLAPNGTINSSFPDQVHHLTDVSNCLDGNPATYWLLQPQEDPTTVTVDLGAIFQIMSIEIRFASVDGEDYFASRFYTEMGTELVSWEMFEVDAQQGSRTMSHYFQVYRLGRYVRFVFEQVFGLNPEGRLGIEDFVIRKVSDNLARRSGVTVSASSSWVEAEPIIYDGNLRPHDGAFAVDDNFDTWFGAAYGLTDFANAFLQVTFPSLVLVDIAAVRWKYPASEIFGLCSAGLEGEDFSTVANVDKNTAYVTPVVFYSSYACRRVRVTLGPNMGTFGQQPVIAIREIEVYSTQEDITLNRPVSANDGSVAAFATDDSDVTVWSSLSLNETWLTIDTESNFSAWGARILSPSTSIIDAFDIQVSDDGDVFDTVYTVQSNLNNDLWVIQRFSGRYVRFVFKVSLANAFYVRTIRIFATPNLALGQETYAPYRWDHSGVEAVDGLNETIWLSEPLATRANVRLDLGEQTFIAGGMELFWLYPPTDFGIFLSNDTVSWEVLWSTTGNYNYATVIGCPDLCYWESQYIEIRMTRASPDNGDGLYALKSFNVYFDTNLAHFKPITATKTMPGNPFAPENAIDGDESSFWMPAQRASNSYITFDMTYDVLICGFTVNWVRPPVQYYVEYEEADTFIWKFVNRWVTWGGFANVGYQQEWFDGFPARRLRVTIEEKHLLPEGRVSALADVHLNVWERSENLALNRQVIPSEETILGNLASNAVDGNERGTYWYPAEGSPQAWIIVQLDPIAPVPGVPPQGHPVGRIVVVWRFPPGDLTLERQMNQEWLMLAQWTDYMELITDWAGMRSANAIRLNIDKSNTVCDPPDPFCQEIGILEIKVYKYAYSLPNAVEPDVNPWSAVPEYMVDPDKDSYWMGPPLFDGDNIYISVDLGKVYNATDIEIYFGWRAQVVYLSISEDAVNYIEKPLSSGNVLGLLTLAEKGLTFQVRYVTLWVQRGFQDAETGKWGTTVRDFGVLQFSNIVRGKVPITDSVWEYPGSWTVDDDLSTEWTSRFGALEARLIYDLGRPRNVAGMTWVFGHIAGRVDVHYANRNDNRSNWQKAYGLVGNIDTDIMVPTTVHFKCRYIRLTLFEPRTREFWHPDHFEDTELWNSLLSLKDFKAYEHTGGGGVLGFQSVDGMQYTTITYGLRQPGEWILSSEEDLATQDLTVNYTFNDVGSIVHIAMTKQKVGGDSTHRLMQYALYRNGMTYGMPYTVREPVNRMNGVGSTRVVLGVRSSAHYPVPATDPGPTDPDPRNGVIHGFSHSPFFEGWIYNVTLFKNALTAEEVRGLYEAHAQGGQEVGCHCFDACPTGGNRFFPNVQVPCSGQGACLRTSGQAFARGRCECNPGYSGDACQHHCSDLSTYGCCEVDDDCPVGHMCDLVTHACYEPTA
ncbi:unnamed protein product [Effrenium voratum]|uniref:Uncharacterized protein n=1 Tax=Effrenium voratum TaxID=2562239 RepID=A0AA36MXV6_9DINO|nr:unnamed protein product [Effrenium voratum]